MDWPYAHLLVNHVPIILSGLGAGGAVLALLLRRRALWLYATATLTLGGLGAYPAKLTGERAGEAMERMWYVDEQQLHDHEEASELATWVLLAAAAISGFAWWRLTRVPAIALPERARHDPLPLWLRSLVVASALAGAGSVTYAAYQGGIVVHKAEALLVPPDSAHIRRAAAPGEGRRQASGVGAGEAEAAEPERLPPAGDSAGR